MQALGGAKNHMVVLPDADIDMAADAAVSAAYGSAGERCMAVSVVVAVGDVADDLVARDQGATAEGQDRAGTEPENEMGPLITREHRDKVASYIDGAREQGATVVADGRDSTCDGDGFFLGVSLLDEVTPEMDAYRDEIFGPVLSVVRVETYDEAVRLVNENPYGNGTAIFTRDGGVARQFQFDARAGMVGDQRADPGAGRLLLVRRLEVVALRRLAHLRAGRDQLLHARQGRHEPLAGSGHEQGRPGLPADPLTLFRRKCCATFGDEPRQTRFPRCGSGERSSPAPETAKQRAWQVPQGQTRYAAAASKSVCGRPWMRAKSSSKVTRCEPQSRVAAAIQMSFTGIGVAARFREAKSSP